MKPKMIARSDALRLIVDAEPFNIDNAALPWVPLSQIWQLKDGSILVFDKSDSEGQLFPDVESFKSELRRAVTGAKAAANRLNHVVNDSCHLVRHLSSAQATIAANLPVESSGLDFSMDSLVRIDKELGQVDPETLNHHGLVSALIAYVGEVMRRACDGKWSIQKSGRRTRPLVVGRDGRMHDPGIIVLDECLERTIDNRSLRGAVDGELNHLRPLDR